MIQLANTTTLLVLFSFSHSFGTKKLVINTSAKGMISEKFARRTLNPGFVIADVYHLSKGPISNNNDNPAKINCDSSSLLKYSKTDFPIRKAITIKMRPSKRFGKVRLLLKKNRYTAKNIPCNSPAPLSSIRSMSNKSNRMFFSNLVYSVGAPSTFLAKETKPTILKNLPISPFIAAMIPCLAIRMRSTGLLESCISFAIISLAGWEPPLS